MIYKRAGILLKKAIGYHDRYNIMIENQREADELKDAIGFIVDNLNDNGEGSLREVLRKK